MFRFWEPPPEVPSFCHAHASSSCERGCAQLCGCIAAAAKVAAHIVVNFVSANVKKNSDFQVPILET